MKKLFALMLVLAMLLACAASAEVSTAYTLSIQDPQISYGADTIDMSGLSLDLSLAATDGAAQGLIAQLYADDQMAAQATLEIAGDMIYMYLNGMSKAYTYRIDPAMLAQMGVTVTGLENMDLATAMTQLPLRTALLALGTQTVDMSAIQGANRLAMYADIPAGPVAIDADTGAQLVSAILDMGEQQANVAAETMAELRGADLALTLDGNVENNGSEFTFTANGELMARAANQSLPYTISYLDNGADIDLILTVAEDVTFEIKYVDAIQTCSVSFAAPGTSMSLSATTANNPRGEGFAVELNVDSYGDVVNFNMEYAGEVVSVEGTDLARQGKFSVGATAQGQTVGFTCNILMTQYDVDTVDWTVDGMPTDTIENIASDSTAQTEATGIAMTLLGTIMQKAPSIASMMG